MIDQCDIREGCKCNDCGWPIIDACCNDSFADYKDAAKWDWWLYCSNKGCKNHDGQGVWQDMPEWIVSTSEGVYVRVVLRDGEWQVGNGQRSVCDGIACITTIFGTFEDGKWICDNAVTCEIIDYKTYRLLREHQKNFKQPSKGER